jgi:hypothetical protein
VDSAGVDPDGDGALAFSAGSQRDNVGRHLQINDKSEQRIRKALLEKHLPMEQSALELGDASFQSGWMFHRRGSEQERKTRKLKTMKYRRRHPIGPAQPQGATARLGHVAARGQGWRNGQLPEKFPDGSRRLNADVKARGGAFAPTAASNQPTNQQPRR